LTSNERDSKRRKRSLSPGLFLTKKGRKTAIGSASRWTKRKKFKEDSEPEELRANQYGRRKGGAAPFFTVGEERKEKADLVLLKGGQLRPSEVGEAKKKRSHLLSEALPEGEKRRGEREK